MFELNDIDYLNLPKLPELAFLEFEKRVRTRIQEAAVLDKQQSSRTFNDQPLRFYVSAIITFLQVYKITDLDVLDISEAGASEFMIHFKTFRNRVRAYRVQCSLKLERERKAEHSTPIKLSSDFKDIIASQLNVIRKIVRQEIKDTNKRDAILDKIASLQSEIDRDRTSVDQFFCRLIDFSLVIRECGENILPLIEKVDNLLNLPVQRPQDLVKLATSQARKMLPKLNKTKNSKHNKDDDHLAI